jgi:predicted MFS family arabinose efflux permease
MASTLAPLRVRPFPRLLTSYTINEVGDSVGLVALALLVYAETGDALATTLLFVAGSAVPALLAPALTARLDQMALRRALPGIYVCEAIVFALLAFVADAFFLPLVVALALADGTLAVTGRGLTRGAVAALLKPVGKLREGNALMNVGFAIAAVGGAALGGLLVDGVGVSAALALDAASFLVIAVVLAMTPGLPTPETTREPVFARLRDGIAYARSTPAVRVLLGGEALALAMFTMVVPIEVVYARETLQTDEAGFGLLLAAWGAGLVVGSLLFVAARGRRLLPMAAVATAVIGIAYIGMGAVDVLWAACALSVLGGAGNGVQWVAVVTAIQESTPERMQARVSGFLESINKAVPGVGFVIGGVLTAVASPPIAFIVAGATILTLLLAVALFAPRPLLT